MLHGATWFYSLSCQKATPSRSSTLPASFSAAASPLPSSPLRQTDPSSSILLPTPLSRLSTYPSLETSLNSRPASKAPISCLPCRFFLHLHAPPSLCNRTSNGH
uniref:UDP-glycosyltransferase 90A1 n=1 Tax=Rhizophora mucronata TaxID=61149 RepID=A0A2P2QKX3_RHIMU